jgi:hypothetical protein
MLAENEEGPAPAKLQIRCELRDYDGYEWPEDDVREPSWSWWGHWCPCCQTGCGYETVAEAFEGAAQHIRDHDGVDPNEENYAWGGWSWAREKLPESP